ncbi:alpha/beta hydrolase [Xanthomonas campestris pv. badrii]|uniref:Alpha/beta hydrolase n=1 Tax=Xanthomonas campestris pv. badrii TaxID=149696 RepID=A0A7Z2V7Q1_XANCA|nr:alpha/beta hydrolase [Xanthomonas campestris]MCC4605444.1 alpha/beta hydrolase [Xanthomonas campestris pv. parthenii]QJD66470.1 alpha/beta hydrolase [Xanthomonas campestris pv. badrii]
MTSTLHLVSPEAREIASSFPRFVPDLDAPQAFRDMLASLNPLEAVAHTEHRIPSLTGAPAVRVLMYRPEGVSGPLPALLYIHGGGFVAGSPDMMSGASWRLAQRLGVAVVAVQYRLAPETPFPGPVEDCHAALAWLFNQAEALGVDPRRIAIYGQSAGGGLAAATALLARERGEHALAAQFLLYPMLDPRTGTPDAPVDNASTGQFLWTREANRKGWTAMRGTQPIAPERLGHFGPALADNLAGLPPTFMAVGSVDLFLEEDVAYALRLSRAGVAIDLQVYAGGVHGFEALPGANTEAYWQAFDAAARRWLLPA